MVWARLWTKTTCNVPKDSYVRIIISYSSCISRAPEVAKKSKSEKRKEANKKRRKRLSDMKKEV